MLALDCALAFDPPCEDEFFSALPSRPAVFVIELHHPEAEPYLVRTADMRRRLERLLRAPETLSKRLNLRECAARVRYRLTGSLFEQNLVLYQQARQLFPRRYRDLLRLRPPALLKVNLSNEYPRCYVTRRILADGGFYFGPFPSRRVAEAFSNEFLNLFKLRRCQIKIRRDPSFPGCIYSEMKMCLAPCFAGCSKTEYDVEAARVVAFLASCGASLQSDWQREREAASEGLDFERAAAIHRKLDKLAEVLRGLPELPRKLGELNAVILQRAAREQTLAVFAIRAGRIADPFFLRFDELSSLPRSIEAILREQLEASAGPPRDTSSLDGEKSATLPGSRPEETLADHLALLARWFYGKPRVGEILFPQTGGGTSGPSAGTLWPYRRILRACSRLLTSVE
jgi:excinuclease UvrABC nuclease subunit